MVPMIEKTIDTSVSNVSAPNQAGKKYHMVKNERTAGSIPSYSLFDRGEAAHSSFREVLSDTHVSKNHSVDFNSGSDSRDSGTDDAFGFGDLLDMVNPLQHIPLVNLVYREVTGDEIRPVGKIIGGGVFGGPVGMASGLVDAVIKDGTGKDVSAHALSFIDKNEDPSSFNERVLSKAKFEMDAPEPIDQSSAYDDLPASLLAFAEQPMTEARLSDQVIADTVKPTGSRKGQQDHGRDQSYTRAAGGRTAGYIKNYV